MYADHIGLRVALRLIEISRDLDGGMRQFYEIDARCFGARLRRNKQKEHQYRASSSAHDCPAPRKAESLTRQELLKRYPVPPPFGIAVDQHPRLFLMSALGQKQPLRRV